MCDKAGNTEGELIEFYILFIFSLAALVLSEWAFFGEGFSLRSALSSDTSQYNYESEVYCF